MSDEYRFSKIDDAIKRLAEVSADLSRMLAVHNQRIDTQEKVTDSILTAVEKRRTEVDDKFRDLQNSFNESISQSRASSTQQHIDQNKKIDELSKMIWMGMGIIGILSIVIPPLISKFFH
jgi:hypothetical protein